MIHALAHGLTQFSKEFLWLSTSYSLPFALFHRHLQFMLEERMSKQERAVFTQLPSLASTIDYLEVMGLDIDPP